MKNPITRLIIGIIISSVFFFIMFSKWTSYQVNFWLIMSLAAISLSLYTLLIGWTKENYQPIKLNLKSIAIGIGSAALLWGVFWLGNIISTQIFSFAAKDINSIYNIKLGYNQVIIGLLLVFLIGPAEEVFWRGYIQRTLSEKYGPNIGLVFASLIYALVHIWSFNPMLILAALVAGGFWGLMYRINPNNLLPLIISHALWDVSVFIIFPIT